MGLIGETILIEVNPLDISYIKAYLEDGAELGILTATGEWGRKPHSIKTRQETKRFAKENGDKNSSFYANITGYEDELRKRAKDSTRARTKASIIKREQSKRNSLLNVDDTHGILPEEESILAESEAIISSVKEFINTSETNSNDTNNNRKSYSPDIEEKLLNMSIEEAFEKGLL